MAVFLCGCVSGCHPTKHTVRRKSVTDLYLEAMESVSARPPVIQQQFPPVAINVRPAALPGAELLPPIPTTDSPAAIQAAEPLQGTSQVAPPGVFPGGPQPIDGVPAGGPGASPVQFAVNQEVVPHANEQKRQGPAAQIWSAPVQPVSYQSDDGGPLVSEHTDGGDILEILQNLADIGQVNIIPDPLVNGDGTLHCDNEPLERALQRVLTPLGLYYVRHGKDYYVAPANPNAALFQFIAVRTQFRPQYHKIAVLAPLVPPRYKQYFHTSVERNLATIEAPKQLADEVARCFKELDTPIPQVELEAIVCVTAPDSTFRFNFNGDHKVSQNSADTLNLDLSGLALTASGTRAGVNQAFSNFAVTSAFVKLLAQQGYITIRAAPRVTAKDGEKASISISRETFFSLQPSSSNLLFRQDVQKVEAGIMLEIIPRVHDDMIGVQILRAEVSEDIRSLEASASTSSNTYPTINRRQVTTEVDVQDGNTIVIGGLVQRQTVDRTSRIPGLSDIPALGKLFQTIEKQEQEAEVAIFISPRIVPLPDCR